MKGIATFLMAIGLVGCVTTPGYVVAPPPPPGAVIFEPDVIVGGYNIGYYREGYGYWTGRGWDANFYVQGHPGWGHYYRGAPDHAWGAYHGGPYYRGAGGRYHR
jgi:hypothetical protein